MRFLTIYFILFIFWIIWSGKFDLFHLALGVISTYLVTKGSGDLFFDKKKSFSLPLLLKKWLRFEIYLFWLVWEIFKANLHVINVALSSDMFGVLKPSMISFKTSLKSDISKFVLAQSITLTPGTVTVDIDKDTVYVHALTKQTAAGTPGNMERKVAHIFGEKI